MVGVPLLCSRQGPSGAPAEAQPGVLPAALPALVPPRVATGRPVTLAFGGDVHFERSSASALSGGLAAITPLLSRADLTMVNLETAVTSGGTPAAKEYTFRAPPSAFGALSAAGVDVVTLANNHGMDYGVDGLRDTLASAREADVPLVGAGQDETAAFAPFRTEVHGQRLAFLGATQVLDSGLEADWTAGPGKPGLASAKNEERLLAAVRAARADGDTVVVDLHWGQEQRSCPLDRQSGLARRLVDAGADVVVGSHAHVLLGGGWLSGAYVDYGLGNFVFYARGGAAAQTGVLTLTVRGHAVTHAEWAPAVLRGGVPRPLSGAPGDRALAVKERLRDCAGLASVPG